MSRKLSSRCCTKGAGKSLNSERNFEINEMFQTIFELKVQTKSSRREMFEDRKQGTRSKIERYKGSLVKVNFKAKGETSGPSATLSVY